MADTGEIVAGATGLGAFFGAFYGAIKFFGRKPDPERERENPDMAVVIKRLENIERRQTEIDTRLNDVFHLLEKASDGLAACRVDIATALAKLEERRIN